MEIQHLSCSVSHLAGPPTPDLVSVLGACDRSGERNRPEPGLEPLGTKEPGPNGNARTDLIAPWDPDNEGETDGGPGSTPSNGRKG